MIRIAHNAGFCFGVKRASSHLENLLAQFKVGAKIYTFGDLIHNPTYLARLKKLGVTSVISYDEIRDIA